MSTGLQLRLILIGACIGALLGSAVVVPRGADARSSDASEQRSGSALPSAPSAPFGTSAVTPRSAPPATATGGRAADLPVTSPRAVATQPPTRMTPDAATSAAQTPRIQATAPSKTQPPQATPAPQGPAQATPPQSPTQPTPPPQSPAQAATPTAPATITAAPLLPLPSLPLPTIAPPRL